MNERDGLYMKGLGYGWIWVDKGWLTQLRWVLGWGMLGRVSFKWLASTSQERKYAVGGPKSAT